MVEINMTPLVDVMLVLLVVFMVAAPLLLAHVTHAAGEFGPTVAVFPREWLRDPESRNLIDHVVDVPWDDPGLIEALVAMRHDT